MRLVVMGKDPFPPSDEQGMAMTLHPQTRNTGKHIVYTGGQYDSHVLLPVIPPSHHN